MKIKIKVTKDILKKAMYCGIDDSTSVYNGGIGQNCAIALAVRDVFPDAIVGLEEMYFTKDDLASTELPVEAKEFIDRFDMLGESPAMRLDLDEFEFEINVPKSIINSINIEDIHNSKNLELV